jgi:hypothetical protein
MEENLVRFSARSHRRGAHESDAHWEQRASLGECSMMYS